MKLINLINQYLNNIKLQNNLDSKTIKAYNLDLNQFYKNVKNKFFFEREQVLNYIFYLNNNNYSIKTIKRKTASLKAFFSYLNCEGIIKTNPFDKIKIKMKEPFTLPKIISFKDINTIFNYAYKKVELYDKKSTQYKESIKNILVLELLICTGIRISELCEINQSDIVESNNYIKIYGKGSKERIIPIYNKNILKILTLYRSIYLNELKDTKYLFLNKWKNKLSTQSVRNMINQYSKESGVKSKITPHMFRHTFATMLLDDNVDIRNIQIILGHSSITTTQIYTHVTSNKKAQIMKFNNPRSKLNVYSKLT